MRRLAASPRESWPPPLQSEVARDALVLALLIAWLVARFALRPLGHTGISNEMDVLPFAKQFMDPDWLPRDWYLNRDIGYRQLFDAPMGLALRSLPFNEAAVYGRALVCAAFSGAMLALFRALGIDRWLLLPVVYLFLRDQSLVAGEWILRSLETKPFAYAAVLAALAALIRQRYAWMWGLAGLALSFHVLVGGYGGYCLALCLLMQPHRSQLRRVLRPAWLFALTGGLGLAAVADYLLRDGGLHPVTARFAAETYVRFRVPHHTLPEAWGPPARWAAPLLAWTALFAGLRVRGEPRARMLAQFALAAASLFAIGLGIRGLGRIDWLKLYWFRLPDTLLPLLGPTALALLASRALLAAPGGLPAWRRWLRRLARATALAATAWVCVTAAVPFALDEPADLLGRRWQPRALRIPPLEDSPMTRWVREHTPRDALFAVDPGHGRFTVEAERAVLVSFKSSPQSEPDILEWIRRLEALNGGPLPKAGGSRALRAIGRNYERLGAGRLRALRRDFGVDYVVTRNHDLPLPRIYRDDHWSIYSLAGEESEG